MKSIYVVLDNLLTKEDDWETHFSSILHGYIESNGLTDCEVTQYTDWSLIKCLFEKKMIEKTNKDSSDIETDYGYKLKNKVPLKYTFIGVLKSILGLIAFNKLLFLQKNNSYISTKNKDFNNKLSTLNLPIKLELLKNIWV